MINAISASNILRRWGFSLRHRGQRSGVSGPSAGSTGGLNSSAQQLEVQTKCGKCVYTRQQHKSAAATTPTTAQTCSHHLDQQDLHHIHQLQVSSTDQSSSELYAGQQNFPLECLTQRRKRKAAQLKQRLQQDENQDLETSFKARFCPHRRRKRKKDVDKDGAASLDGSCSLSNHSIHRYLKERKTRTKKPE